MNKKQEAEKPYYLVVHRAFPGKISSKPEFSIYGLTWKLWADKHSFYATSRWEMNDHKLSLHGPSEAHPESSLFKYARHYDGGSSPRLSQSELLPYGRTRDTATVFRGNQVRKGVFHVVRFRWTHDVFKFGAPPDRGPGVIRKPGKIQSVESISAPDDGFALDVDLYLSNGRPYNPRGDVPEDLRHPLPKIANGTDQWLTGLAQYHSLKRHPTPEPLGGNKVPSLDAPWLGGRALQVFPDPRGYLHMQEWLVPASL